MRSTRFDLAVVLTEQARLRMAERSMSVALVLEIIDTSIFLKCGHGHWWLYKHFPERADNLLCVAAVIENVMLVKNVMHHWEPMP